MAARNPGFWARNRGMAMFGVTAYLVASPAFGFWTGTSTTFDHAAVGSEDTASAESTDTSPLDSIPDVDLVVERVAPILTIAPAALVDEIVEAPTPEAAALLVEAATERAARDEDAAPGGDPTGGGSEDPDHEAIASTPSPEEAAVVLPLLGPDGEDSLSDDDTPERDRDGTPAVRALPTEVILLLTPEEECADETDDADAADEPRTLTSLLPADESDEDAAAETCGEPVEDDEPVTD